VTVWGTLFIGCPVLCLPLLCCRGLCWSFAGLLLRCSRPGVLQPSFRHRAMGMGSALPCESRGAGYHGTTWRMQLWQRELKEVKQHGMQWEPLPRPTRSFWYCGGL
jgi:hypothetical protein